MLFQPTPSCLPPEIFKVWAEYIYEMVTRARILVTSTFLRASAGSGKAHRGGKAILMRRGKMSAGMFQQYMMVKQAQEDEEKKKAKKKEEEAKQAREKEKKGV